MSVPKIKLLATASALASLGFAAAAAAQQTPAPPQPAGTAQTPAPAPVGGDAASTTATAPDSDVIVVTGFRRSLESAQEMKRSAPQILDAIVAEDIGKLPDITVSQSLARVTGVQVTRASGEAAGVQVRGLPDLSTTYNGREIFTAEGRAVALQDFPAGAVSALEVFKSNTAERIEGGIAGQINVRSFRPFDFDGLKIAGTLNGIHTDERQELDWNGNLLVSNRWDTGIGEIGALVNVAYTRIRFLDPAREQSALIQPATDEQTDQPGFVYPDSQGIYYGSGKRWRPSVNAAIQWRPSDVLEFYVDGLFQGYRGRDDNRFLNAPIFNPAEGESPIFTDVVLKEGTNQLQSATISNAYRPEGFQSTLVANTDTYQIGGGAIWTGMDGLTVSSDLSYTDSTFSTQTTNVDFAYTSSPVRDAVFDSPNGDGGPAFSFRDFDIYDPENYIFRGLFDQNREGSGKQWAGTLDVEYETDWSFLTTLQAGIRYSDRDAQTRLGTRYQYIEGLGITYPELPLVYQLTSPGFRHDDVQRIRGWVAPTFDSIVENADALREIAGVAAGQAPYDPLNAFVANEKSYTAYGQVGYAFDIGIPIDGQIGVRAVKTETAISGNSREFADGEIGEIVPVTADRDYTDVLPNVSARVEFTPEVQLRLAYTETRTRPGFGQLNPSTIYDPISGLCQEAPDSPNCFRSASGGNPDLRPLESKNYDASLEWYFSRTGSLTGAVFNRDVDGFISNVLFTLPDPDYNELRLTIPQNGGSGRIRGAEVAFTSFLDFEGLPEWAQGFGFQANYTYIDASQELPEGLAATLPGQQPIPGVSEHNYNLVGLYERPEFSARLAYNFRSKFTTGYGIIGDGQARGEMQDDYGILDFSMNVTPVEGMTVNFNVSNLLATPVEIYRPYNDAGDAFPVRRRYLDRVFSLGVRFDL